MDWKHIQEQIDAIDTHEVPMLPVTGGLLQARVGVAISAGLVDLNKVLKQATVRREIVVQLIRMKRDAGHPDYQKVNMADVQRRARELAPTDAPTVPSGVTLDFVGLI